MTHKEFIMKTNTTEPTATIEETAKLTQLANFIQYRKQQKSQLTNTETNKNSLSKENQINDQKTKEKPKILQIFDELNNQLSEGHTVYEMTVNNEDEKSLIAELTDNNWASVIGAGDELRNHDTNAPIILQKLAQAVDEVVETRNGDGDASVRGSYSSFNNVHTLPLRVHLAPQGGGFYHNTLRTASLFQEQLRCR